MANITAAPRIEALVADRALVTEAACTRRSGDFVVLAQTR